MLVQEPDRVATSSVIAVVIATVLVVVGAIMISGLLLSVEEARFDSAAPEHPAIAPREISGVDQTLIIEAQRGRVIFDRQRAELEEYRWIDREHGLIRVPIDVAMDLELEGAKR
jgi:hypothetical protein